MTPGIYSIVSGMTARAKLQEQIAQNLSNANSLGHRRVVGAIESFTQVLNHTENGTTRDPYSPLPALQAPRYDWSPGEPKKTDQPLDAIIDGPGFFQVETPAGIRLTRNGHFMVNADKKLVDEAGYFVLDGNGGQIDVGDGIAALQANGKLLVNGQDTGKTVGVVTVEEQDLALLQSENGGLFKAPSRVSTTKLDNAQLSVGALEWSNVKLPSEMANMIQNSRMYDMLTRAFQAEDERMQRAINDLGTIS